MNTLKGHYALCFKTHPYFGAHDENLNEGRPILSRCSPMTLASGNIRFMRIFAGVPWRGGVERQWDNRKRRFSWLSDAVGLWHLRKWGQHYCIVLFCPFVAFLLATPKYMILKDFEILNGHFTLNFHYYELLLRVIIYLFTVESVYINTWPAYMCGSGVADRDPQNIWNPRKNCGSFVDATSSET